MWLFNKLCVFSYSFVYQVRYCLDEYEMVFSVFSLVLVGCQRRISPRLKPLQWIVYTVDNLTENW